MDDLKEFPSPFAPSTPGVLPITQPKPVVSSFSGSGDDQVVTVAQPAVTATGDHSIPPKRLSLKRSPAKKKTPLDRIVTAITNDPSLFAFVAGLAAKPQGKRIGGDCACPFWQNYLTGIERAKVIKATLSELRDEDVAELAGVARETLVRNREYRRVKQFVEAHPPASSGKYRGRTRRPIEPLLDEDECGDEDNPQAGCPV
jgi:hypothetical protein